MIAIGTHRQVTVYAVQGWRAGTDPLDERFGATCEMCGVWRAPSDAAVREAMMRVPCGFPPGIDAEFPAMSDIVARLA